MMLLLNAFLALAWAAIMGDLSVVNLLVGFALGYVVLWFARRAERATYFSRVYRVLRFAIHFVSELVVATLRVAVDVVTPQHLVKPAILAVTVDTESDAETTLLANTISLTPGTLVLDVSPDGKTLYVHVMYADDVEKVRNDIQQGFGRRVREVFE